MVVAAGSRMGWISHALYTLSLTSLRTTLIFGPSRACWSSEKKKMAFSEVDRWKGKPYGSSKAISWD